MFKIKDSTIHCSRGDSGIITLRIPIIDKDNNIKYKDTSNNIYWYNTKTKTLYDSNYEVSTVEISTLSIVYHQFKEGDTIKLNIYEKNGYDKEPLKTKKVIAEDESSSIDIDLTESDTTFGDEINKATIFWYDITLNETQTVVCYDEDGAKEFIEYPAKGDEVNVNI